MRITPERRQYIKRRMRRDPEFAARRFVVGLADRYVNPAAREHFIRDALAALANFRERVLTADSVRCSKVLPHAAPRGDWRHSWCKDDCPYHESQPRAGRGG